MSTHTDEVQVVRFGLWWPDGRPDQLRARAAAWRRMAAALMRCGEDLLRARQVVQASCHGAAIDAYLAHQQRVLTALNDEADACTQLARSLEDFADAIDAARHRLLEMAAEIAASMAIGFGLAMLTAGISATAAETVTAAMIAQAGVMASSLTGQAIAIASRVVVIGAFGAGEAGATNLIIQVERNAVVNQNHNPLDGIELPEMLVSGAGGFVVSGAFAGLTTPRLPLPPVVGLTRTEAEEVAETIGSGHAWKSHGKSLWELPWIESQDAFIAHIADVVEHPSAVRRLDDFRTAFWDDASGTVVIRDLRTTDGGTAFQPKDGRMYFLKELRPIKVAETGS